MKLLHESLSNLSRHRFMTVATIISISLILVIFNVLITVNYITKTSINELAKKIDYVVYIDDKATSDQTVELVSFVKKFQYVNEATFTYKDKALEKISEKYPSTTKFLEDFEIENPLPNSIKIKTNTVEDHEKIKKELNQSKFKNLILKSEIRNEHNLTINKVVQNLVRIKEFSLEILLWMILTFITAGGLIIFNALRTTLHSRKSEIQIMQFVGATFNKIMLPFVVEGAILGFSSFILSVILMAAISQFLPLQGIQSTNFFSTPGLTSIFLLEAIIAISIGTLTSLHAVNSYLNSKEIFND